MVAPKTLEIIFRGRNELSSATGAAARDARKLGDEVAKADAQVAKLGRRRQHLIRDLERNKTQQRAINDLVAKEQRIGESRARVARQLTGERQKQAELLRKESAERLTVLQRERQALAGTRSGLVADLRGVTDQRTLMRGRAVGAADAALAQSAVNLQRQQADLGDRRAAQQLRLNQLTTRQVAAQRLLLDVLRSQHATQTQKAAAQRQLNALSRVHYQQQLAAARLNPGLGRAAVGGAISGAAFAGAGPIGLLAGAGAAGLGTTGIVAGGAGTVAFGGVASVRQAAQFESSMARVRALTQAAGDDFAALENRAKTLGRTTTFTAMQAADAMGNFALAGFEVNQIIAAIEPTLRLAEAGELDLANSTRIVARVMAGLGIEARDVGDAVDVLTAAMTTANTDLGELGTAFEFVGPIAKTVDSDLRGTAAALQVLANRGFAGEKGGTAMRQILIKLANQTGEAQRTLERYNIELLDTEGNLKALPAVVAEFERALAGMGSGQRLNVLSTVFEARAAAGFAAILDEGSESLQRFEDKLGDVDGVAQRVAEDRLDSLSGAGVRFKSAISGLGIEIGQNLSDPLTDVVDAATAATNAITDLIAAESRIERLAQQRDVTGTASALIGPDGLPRTDSGREGLIGGFLNTRAILKRERERNAAITASQLDIATSGLGGRFLAAEAQRDDVLAAVLAQRQRNEVAKSIAAGGAEALTAADQISGRQTPLERQIELAQEFAELENNRRESLAGGITDQQTATTLLDEANRFAAARLSLERQIADAQQQQAAALAQQQRDARLLLDPRQRAAESAASPFFRAATQQALQGNLGLAGQLGLAGAGAGNRALDAFDRAERQRRQTDLNRAADTLAGARIASLLDAGTPAGDAAAEVLRIEQSFDKRRQKLLDLLDSEVVTTQQRVEAQKRLAELPGAEATAIRRARAAARPGFTAAPDAKLLTGSRDRGYGAFFSGANTAEQRRAQEAERARQQREKHLATLELINEGIRNETISITAIRL
ncbi:MAG: phage tail tape measure protein [Planctomycetota bacterium]